ncbi:MAG: arsenite methyltransferase [Saprospiraceae bacterium]|nr:arsenite methyltransferase [Saprospiraceae bacterium]
MKTENELKNMVREKYASIAKNPSKGGCCDTDSDGIEYSFIGDEYGDKVGYVADADLGLGCGLPTEFAKIKAGQTVVDLGSGAGNDCFIARAETGPNGKVIGLDFTLEMVEKARVNAKKMNYENVEFYLGEIDHNPLPDNTADVVVSNCVFNLIPNRKKAFAETFRIIKPGGHFSISDVVTLGDIPPQLREEAELYAGCVSGAMNKQEYLETIEAAGFKNITIQKERQINISPEILDKYLSEEKKQIWNDAKVGIFSITVYGEKVGPEDCCEPACCN